MPSGESTSSISTATNQNQPASTTAVSSHSKIPALANRVSLAEKERKNLSNQHYHRIMNIVVAGYFVTLLYLVKGNIKE